MDDDDKENIDPHPSAGAGDLRTPSSDGFSLVEPRPPLESMPLPIETYGLATPPMTSEDAHYTSSAAGWEGGSDTQSEPIRMSTRSPTLDGGFRSRTTAYEDDDDGRSTPENIGSNVSRALFAEELAQRLASHPQRPDGGEVGPASVRYRSESLAGLGEDPVKWDDFIRYPDEPVPRPTNDKRRPSSDEPVNARPDKKRRLIDEYPHLAREIPAVQKAAEKILQRKRAKEWRENLLTTLPRLMQKADAKKEARAVPEKENNYPIFDQNSNINKNAIVDPNRITAVHGDDPYRSLSPDEAEYGHAAGENFQVLRSYVEEAPSLGDRSHYQRARRRGTPEVR